MAATPIYSANSGVITPETFSNLYSKTIDEVVVRTENVVREGAQFFDERSSSLGTYTEAEVASTLDLPIVRNDDDEVPLFQPTQGHSQTWTKVIYKSGIAITRSAVEEQRHKEIARMIAGLPKSVMRREEYAYASPFNSGFATMTGADGSYVFATDHEQFDNSRPAWSNRPSSGSAFNTDTFEVARLAFDNFVDEKGFPNPQPISKLVFPTALWEDVQQVLNSEKYPQNALNAANPYMKMVTPVKYHWLTSATAWFVQGSSDAMDQGFLFVRFAPNTYLPISWSENPDILLGRRARASFAVGVSHARTWYGNPGA